MRFTVTSGVDAAEVVDRPESARAALEHFLKYLGVSGPMFGSLIKTAGVEAQRIYAGWQQTKLQCCQAELLSPSKAISHRTPSINRRILSLLARI